MMQKFASFQKKIIIFVLSIILALTLVPNIGNAQICTEGGLVPCNRNCDDPGTVGINDSQPCNLCAVFYMIKSFINLVTTTAVTIAVFILVFSGLLYALSAGNPSKIQFAKSATNSVFIGLAIISVAWLGVAFILQGMGYNTIDEWDQVNCNLPTT